MMNRKQKTKTLSIFSIIFFIVGTIFGLISLWLCGWNFVTFFSSSRVQLALVIIFLGAVILSFFAIKNKINERGGY